MGTIYQARDLQTGRPAAVKLLFGVHEGLSARFARECEVLATLKHPGIVRHLSHGAAPGGAQFLAMEWLQGRDLAARLQGGPLTTTQSLRLLRGVAEAVAHAHAHGVIHRDLKPSNIFLIDDAIDHVKVLDFGIAAFTQSQAQPLTRTGVALGTPGYMAPEQARGEAAVDARADVYALGCVLYHALVGRGPFHSSHYMAALVKSVLQATPSLSAAFPDVPPEVDAFTQSLMAKDPAQRPADARALLKALDALGDVRQTSAPTGPAHSSPVLTRDEQRVLSVVMASAIAPRRSDPEAITRETRVGRGDEDFEAQRRQAAKVARRYGGHYEPLLGHGVLVTFEGDGAPTDQAARAARCALALRALWPHAALALATGRGSGTASTSEGEALHRAVERLDLAHRNPDLGPSILMDEASFGLLEGRFEIFCTLLGYVLIDEADPLHAERKLLGKVTPCLGRTRELASLSAGFSTCVAESIAHAVVLTGPPGIGKSRVRQAFVQGLREQGQSFELWLARGDPMRAGSPFALVAELVRAAAGLRGGEAPETGRARLAARVGRDPEDSETTRIIDFLAELISMSLEDSGSQLVDAAREDPLLMGDQMRRAFEDLVNTACSSQPLLLILEDLQWGDLASVQFIDGVLRNLADRPLMVLATARPEVEGLLGKLWPERGTQEIRIGPLNPKASRRLVDAAVQDVEPQQLKLILERAGGHPLLLEEMIRALGEGTKDSLPDTALAMVESRVLALDEEARRILRAASVFGRAFWAGGVAALTAGEGGTGRPEEWLDVLADSEWLVRRTGSRFAPEPEYAFAQDLVREAVYAMLTGQDRSLGHQLAGQWLVQMGEKDDATLALHHELGDRPAEATGYYERAAEQALDGGDFQAVLNHSQRALDLGARQPARGRLRALRAEAHLHLGAFLPALEESRAAVKVLPPAETAGCRAAAVQAQAAGKLGELDDVRQVARKLLDIDCAPSARVAYASAGAATVVQLLIGGERALADAMTERLRTLKPAPAEAALRGHVAKAISAQLAFSGDPGKALAGLRLAVAAFEAAGDVRSVCSLAKTQGWYAGECGALEEGERALLEAIALAERLGLPNLVAHAQLDAGSPLIRLGKLEAARGLLTRALQTFRSQGDHRLEAGALGMLSWVSTLQGDPAQAKLQATQALKVAPSDPVRIPALAFLAQAQLALGDALGAHRTAEQGRALLSEVGVTEEGTALLDLVRAEARAAMGNQSGARVAITEAQIRLLERAQKIGDPVLRSSFLKRIAEHRRILELAEAWNPPTS